MWKIVSIWWWEIRDLETFFIDREIVKLSRKKNPRLLFIPTASSDSEWYYNIINNIYWEKLSCKVDVLYLLKDKPWNQEIENKILNSDIIYVWWWNTLKMMRLFRRLWVDKILYKAFRKWIVLCWVSAWSICFFESWHSNSLSYYDKEKTNYINVSWLWFIKWINCPHYDWLSYWRPIKNLFSDMMKKKRFSKKIWIAIDEKCAVAFIDNKYKVISADQTKNAFLVFHRNWELISNKIEKSQKFLPISDLYEI